MVEAIRDFEIEIDKDEVCHLLGYHKGRRPKASISSLIDEKVDKARDLIQPSCFYLLMDIKEVSSPRVILENGITITVTSDILSWVLAVCQKTAIFVSSIGYGLESRVTQLMEEGEVLKGAILDAIGSLAAETAASCLQDKVHEIANSVGAEITPRYSPGSCDWDITQQRVLFEVMDSSQTGVALSDNCLMTPRKSVSGLIGLGWGEKNRIKLTPCRFCTKKDCPSRR